MSKLLVSIVLVGLFVGVTIAGSPVQVKSTTISPIVENPWKVLSMASITEFLEVSYKNVLGVTSTDTCMVVFESAGEYKLVAPWIQGPGKIIQKHNVTDLGIEKIEVLKR